MNWINRYFNYPRTWRSHRNTIKILNMLSDTELKDIGMTRGEINNLIWLEEDKKVTGKEYK